MEKTLLTLALALLCTAVAAQERTCTGSFSAPATENGVNWTAQWTIFPVSGYISFTVMARTDGYVAIGFSPDRMMPNTDIIVGAVDSTGNISYVSDRYANARAPPAVDLSQDIVNATAEEVMLNGSIYTIVRFTRIISTGDRNDLSLDRMAYLLYAWGTEVNFDPADPMSIQRHGGEAANRGASAEQMDFSCPGPTEPPMLEFIPGDCTGSFAAPGTRDGVNWNAMWTVSADSRYVSFTVMAQTDGWVAIGFSLSREMPNTDVIVGAVDVVANYSYVSDRFAFARAPPRVDESQDIMNPMAQEMIRDGNTYTVVNFITPLDRSTPDDVSLNQRVYVLYALGREVNGNASDPMSINVHGGGAPNRGISDTPISILCDDAATPAAVPDGASAPIATVSVVVLALIALLATLL